MDVGAVDNSSLDFFHVLCKFTFRYWTGEGWLYRVVCIRTEVVCVHFVRPFQ
jgi:hypothetical protein